MLPPPPEGFPKPPNETNGVGFDEDVEDDCVVPKELVGLSLPRRLFVEPGVDDEAPPNRKGVVEDEPNGEVPDGLGTEVPNSVGVLVVDVTGEVEVPEEAPNVEDGGKENPNGDADVEGIGTRPPILDAEFRPRGLKLAMVGADGNALIESNALWSNSVWTVERRDL